MHVLVCTLMRSVGWVRILGTSCGAPSHKACFHQEEVAGIWLAIDLGIYGMEGKNGRGGADHELIVEACHHERNHIFFFSFRILLNINYCFFFSDVVKPCVVCFQLDFIVSFLCNDDFAWASVCCGSGEVLPVPPWASA